MLSRWILALVISLVLSGFATPVATGEFSPEQQELVRLLEVWQKAYDGGDADTLGRLLADDLDFTSRSLKGNYRDKASFLDAYKKWFAAHRVNMTSPAQFIDFLEVKVNGDEASVTRKIAWAQKDWNVGSERRSKTHIGDMIKTMYLRRHDGAWKIYSEK